MNASCDVAGQCTCRRHTRRANCDSCATGTFNLAASNVDGCQSCFCHRRGVTCTSAAGFTRAFVHSLRSSATLPLAACRQLPHGYSPDSTGRTQRTLSETRISDPSLRQSLLSPHGSPTSPRNFSGQVRSGPVRVMEFGTNTSRPYHRPYGKNTFLLRDCLTQNYFRKL